MPRKSAARPTAAPPLSRRQSDPMRGKPSEKVAKRQIISYLWAAFAPPAPTACSAMRRRAAECGHGAARGRPGSSSREYGPSARYAEMKHFETGRLPAGRRTGEPGSDAPPRRSCAANTGAPHRPTAARPRNNEQTHLNNDEGISRIPLRLHPRRVDGASAPHPSRGARHGRNHLHGHVALRLDAALPGRTPRAGHRLLVPDQQSLEVD